MPGATMGRGRSSFRQEHQNAANLNQRSVDLEAPHGGLQPSNRTTNKANVMEEPENVAEVPNQSTSRTSLVSRLTNIYAVPGDVFEALKPAPHAVSNWLVPVVLACLVGVINVWVMFSQPAVQQQMREQQATKFEQMVDQGKITQKQADDIQSKMGDSQFLIMKIAGSVGAVFVSFIWPFALSLPLWLLARWGYKTRIAYMKTVEMVGLCTMIGVLGGVVSMLLIVATGNMYATLGPALLIRDYDLGNKMHLVLSSLNLMTIWYIGVLCVGLSRLTGKSFMTAALWLYGSWAVLRAGIIFSGLGAGGM